MIIEIQKSAVDPKYWIWVIIGRNGRKIAESCEYSRRSYACKTAFALFNKGITTLK